MNSLVRMYYTRCVASFRRLFEYLIEMCNYEVDDIVVTNFVGEFLARYYGDWKICPRVDIDISEDGRNVLFNFDFPDSSPENGVYIRTLIGELE